MHGVHVHTCKYVYICRRNLSKSIMLWVFCTLHNIEERAELLGPGTVGNTNVAIIGGSILDEFVTQCTVVALPW